MKDKINLELFKNKHISILGCGKSGFECALALKKAIAFPFVSDAAEIPTEYKEALKKEGIPFEENGHTYEVLNSDLIVVSPGVKPETPILEKAHSKKIKIVGELEVGYLLTSGKYIAITGTNGKSTVTTLTYELLKDSLNNVIMAGNIGEPLSMYAFQDGVFVLEVSSFQLKTIDKFKPDIGVILNIDQDHMDWHPSFEDYVESKARIFENQDQQDYLILNYDDEVVRNLAKKAKSQVLWISLEQEVTQGAYLSDDKVIINIDGQRILAFSTDELLIKGIHNVFNASVASLIAYLNGVNIEIVREILKRFKGLPHRIEFVTQKNGIKFYDDSKGTNPHAVLWALQGFKEPIILIMGGEDKDLDFHPLRDVIKKHCKLIIAIGKARPKIINTFQDIIEVIPADDMKDAVEKAWSHAQSGDVILLSPGCASFDMFKNYKERGDVFQHWVREITKEN
jgi:UDP-N-acetylmuramoylalanine--D-glutamate ligase